MDERILTEIARELAETNRLLRDIQEQVVDIRGSVRLQRMRQLGGRPDREPPPRLPRVLKPPA
ncbi:MAG: hypothetical protein KGN76_13195 [Acidobacteriota bacterium]|nr:hypothetical protein [Acidobacteriota bacterium]